MNPETAIGTLESLVGNPTEGLPEELFLFVSRVTPLVNVDLLIRDEAHRTLLTWRHDAYYGPGWHVPGGIVRYKETMANRIEAVAASELGATVRFERIPVAVREVINPSRRARGHFISFLFGCTLTSPPALRLKLEGDSPKHGQWAWHEDCPENIIDAHRMYREFIDAR